MYQFVTFASFSWLSFPLLELECFTSNPLGSPKTNLVEGDPKGHIEVPLEKMLDRESFTGNYLGMDTFGSFACNLAKHCLAKGKL